MNKKKKYGESLFAVLFLVALLGFSIANFLYSGAEVLETAAYTKGDEPKERITAVEDEMSEELLFRRGFLESYSVLQVAMGKHEDNAFDVVKDKRGSLYSGNFWNGFGDDPREMGIRTRRLYDRMKKGSTQFGVVVTPMKKVDEEQAYLGIPYSDYSQAADQYLYHLTYYGVPFLDLRRSLQNCPIPREDWFYATDHHWTTETAFEGFCDIIEWMNSTFDAKIDLDGSLRDSGNYETIFYPKVLLGAQGRKTGLAFAGGPEDLTLLLPKDKGHYNRTYGIYSNPENWEKEEGNFEEILVNTDLYGKDLYEGEAANVYLGGVKRYDQIINQNPISDQKILLLRDSYASPVAAMLSQHFAQVDMLWALESTQEEVETILEEQHYDYVLLMIYPENLNLSSFDFGLEVED